MGSNTPNLNMYKPDPIELVDVTAHLNNNLDEIDQFAGNIEGRVTTTESYGGRIDSLENITDDHGNRLLAVEGTNVSQGNAINSLNNRMGNAEGTISNHGGRINALEGDVGQHENKIEFLEEHYTDWNAIVADTYQNFPPGNYQVGQMGVALAENNRMYFWDGTSWETASATSSSSTERNKYATSVGGLGAGDYIGQLGIVESTQISASGTWYQPFTWNGSAWAGVGTTVVVNEKTDLDLVTGSFEGQLGWTKGEGDHSGLVYIWSLSGGSLWIWAPLEVPYAAEATTALSATRVTSPDWDEISMLSITDLQHATKHVRYVPGTRVLPYSTINTDTWKTEVEVVLDFYVHDDIAIGGPSGTPLTLTSTPIAEGYRPRMVGPFGPSGVMVPLTGVGTDTGAPLNGYAYIAPSGHISVTPDASNLSTLVEGAYRAYARYTRRIV